MSRETQVTLNTRTLIGFTLKRGRAWHYREAAQGAEPNHYPEGIPVADVERRLFGWEELVGDVSVTVITTEGVLTIPAENMRGVVRPPKAFDEDDKGEVLAIHSDGWRAHNFRRWLLEHVAILLDDELQVGSAGVLRDGRQAWVQVEMPDNRVTPEGVEFRPFVLAATSHDASIATTYKRGNQKVVCDNTLTIGLNELSPEVRIKHTSGSLDKLTEMRATLQLELEATGDAFAAEVARLSGWRVTDHGYGRFLEAWVPKAGKEGRSLTIADNKLSELRHLWDNDVRVAPWRNTAYGVLAAVNTHAHHVASARGKDRGERNMARVIDGTTAALDQRVIDTLEDVLA